MRINFNANALINNPYFINGAVAEALLPIVIPMLGHSELNVQVQVLRVLTNLVNVNLINERAVKTLLPLAILTLSHLSHDVKSNARRQECSGNCVKSKNTIKRDDEM